MSCSVCFGKCNCIYSSYHITLFCVVSRHCWRLSAWKRFVVIGLRLFFCAYCHNKFYSFNIISIWLDTFYYIHVCVCFFSFSIFFFGRESLFLFSLAFSFYYLNLILSWILTLFPEKLMTNNLSCEEFLDVFTFSNDFRANGILSFIFVGFEITVHGVVLEWIIF